MAKQAGFWSVDDRLAEISAGGETRLSMTIFKDQSLEEAIEIMESAMKSNPSLRVLHEENLSEATQRRTTESGFLRDSRDPLSYRKIEQLRRRAEKLH
ncbi:hypothetical protein JMM63_20940 [Rhodovulum sulfidophilum]|uniref:Uncharacterized protein n=1 Tax=Rhodovulum sulfidophilum TaxID=35806 RepID=A0ABS1RTF8_RHOSU|nr:hypothetical protein [Rhodovulum sulfidophilum]MBL3597983.1 hypothetical protein [Rhodovulum sulfidophilum]MBL3608812.1 hypothetical protein [Rhodovulum sulfidophilum]MCE8439477.1 hypothetical protein [Rhodovulum sulfidophilum]MCE8456231.1 hypothetical protein [Rhodovulum sulfidophilum]